MTDATPSPGCAPPSATPSTTPTKRRFAAAVVAVTAVTTLHGSTASAAELPPDRPSIQGVHVAAID